MARLQANVIDALKLWAWLVAGVLALVASVALGVLTSWKLASNTAQMVGLALAFGGLLVAYLRARHRGETVREQLAEFGRRLIGRQRNDVRVGTSGGRLRFHGGGYAEAGLKDRPDLDVQEQIDLLADYIRRHVMGNFKQVFGQPDKIKLDIETAKDLATDKAAEAYNKAKADLDALRRELDQSAALDLRWAIFGLYLATIGVALAFWT